MKSAFVAVVIEDRRWRNLFVLSMVDVVLVALYF